MQPQKLLTTFEHFCIIIVLLMYIRRDGMPPYHIAAKQGGSGYEKSVFTERFGKR